MISIVMIAIEAAWEVGCPVAGRDKRARIAGVVLRDWESGSRRKMGPAHLAKHLARRLAATFEPDAGLVGPLALDQEFLAAEITRVLSPPIS